MSILLSIHFKDGFKEVSLPAEDNRPFSVVLEPFLTGCDKTVSLELDNSQFGWRLKVSDWFKLMESDQPADWINLESNEIRCQVDGNETFFTIVSEKIEYSLTYFNKYTIAQKGEIAVGRSEECDVHFDSQYLSQVHAILTFENGQWWIQDSSTNGTFVNEQCLSHKEVLEYGDVIYIMGLKLIFLGEIIAVNRQDKVNVRLRPLMEEVELTESDLLESKEYFETESISAFSRSPRKIEPFDEGAVEIEAPPSKSEGKKSPIIFIIGPMLTMPIPLLVGFMLNAKSRGSAGNSVSLFTMLLSASIGLFWAMLNQIYNKHETAANERKRKKHYKKYLERMVNLLKTKHDYNIHVLENMYPSSDLFLGWVDNRDSKIWNRNVNHKDFLNVRIGLGEVPFQASIQVPKERFSMVDDALIEEPHKIYSTFSRVKNSPVTFSLRDEKIIGVIGDLSRRDDIFRLIVAQLAVTHCYTDVRMAFIYKETEVESFEWTKWLPHIWTEDRKLRMSACQATDVKEILYYLTSMLRQRAEVVNGYDENAKNILPHYVIFITDPDLIDGDGISKYLYDLQDYGITCVLLYGEMDKLPNQCKAICQNDESHTGFYHLNQSVKKEDCVWFDHITLRDVSYLARSLSNLYVKELSGQGEIPSMLTFLQMYKAGAIQHLDVLKYWRENRTYESMKALMGFKNGTTPIYLDIHEKFHGPHGLIAGTTGSGKSETIQTYILSMAVNYHPDEIAFILIDYKGGGMANVFQKLPHLAGTITNLDGNQIYRALSSIKSEIRRRQSIFAVFSVNHIDQYAKLFREGVAEEPLPHLIIIADEFAELKKEQPEFMKELVSTARVGRSLGIHLILATQKPAGVVDDEIWSNSRFRLCLKVQDKGDSQEMIKRPEAAFITNPGRGYLQVGNDEIFELFQSGYSGGNYEPQEVLKNKEKTEIEMIDFIGRDITVKKKKKKVEGKVISELEAMVDYLAELVNVNKIKTARQLWYLPLEESINLSVLKAKKSSATEELIELRIDLGMIDDPANQRQEVYQIDLIQSGNLLIIGSASSGKSTLIQTIMYELVTNYTPKDINIYTLDFSSYVTKTFEDLPHVGGVVLQEEEVKVMRLMRQISKEIEERRERFFKAGTFSFVEYKKIDPDGLPAILIVLDNYTNFQENFEDCVSDLIKITREGVSYGIYTIISTTSTMAVSYKLRQNFNSHIGIQLSETSDYRELFGMGVKYMPEDGVKGRGLVLYPEPVEVQFAICGEGSSDYERTNDMKKRFEKITSEYVGTVAKEIPFIPNNIHWKDYKNVIDFNHWKAAKNHIPYVFDALDAKLLSFDLTQMYCLTVTDVQQNGGNQFMNYMMAYLKEINHDTSVIHLKKSMLDKQLLLQHKTVKLEVECLELFINEMAKDFRRRHLLRKEWAFETDEELIQRFIEIDDLNFVIIEDLGELLETINQCDTELKKIFEVVMEQGKSLGVYFIVGMDFAEGMQSKLYSNYSSEKMYKTIIKYKKGIHFGGAVSEQKAIEYNVPYREQSVFAEPNQAYIHSRPEAIRAELPIIIYGE